MMRKLARICGAQRSFEPAELRAIAATIERNVADPGMQLLAPDWQRLRRQLAACHGARS